MLGGAGSALNGVDWSLRLVWANGSADQRWTGKEERTPLHPNHPAQSTPPLQVSLVVAPVAGGQASARPQVDTQERSRPEGQALAGEGNITPSTGQCAAATDGHQPGGQNKIAGQ